MKEDHRGGQALMLELPNIGFGTADLGDIIIPMLVNDILRLSEGEEPEHIVNKKYFR